MPRQGMRGENNFFEYHWLVQFNSVSLLHIEPFKNFDVMMGLWSTGSFSVNSRPLVVQLYLPSFLIFEVGVCRVRTLRQTQLGLCVTAVMTGCDTLPLKFVMVKLQNIGVYSRTPSYKVVFLNEWKLEKIRSSFIYFWYFIELIHCLHIEWKRYAQSNHIRPRVCWLFENYETIFEASKWMRKVNEIHLNS